MSDEKAKLLMKDQPKDDTADLRAQIALLQEQVAALVGQRAQSGGGITADQLETIMSRVVQAQADAHLAAARELAEREQQENLRYPRISVYSYPEGDKARPRPPFKCRIFWNGFDMDWDTTTAAEIELLNRLEPGIFTFKRVDGRTPETLTVNGEKNARGEWSKLTCSFPVKENRDTLPSMYSMLRDALGLKTPEQEQIERLMKEVEDLRRASMAVA